jgi:hypothetical protein
MHHGTERNLFRPDPIAHPLPCVEKADFPLRIIEELGRHGYRLSAGDPVSLTARLGTRRLEKGRPNLKGLSGDSMSPFDTARRVMRK